jgi:hypothetical protein
VARKTASDREEELAGAGIAAIAAEGAYKKAA